MALCSVARLGIEIVDLADLEGMTESMWDDILGVNLKGAFFVTRAAVPLMKKTGGSIVNVASIAGITGVGSSLAYAASKGGMITMTKTLAQALAPEIPPLMMCSRSVSPEEVAACV